MPVTKTYELKAGAGPHMIRGEDSDGRAIDRALEPGDRIRSDKPYNKMFPNKFVCVDEQRAEDEKKSKRGPFTEPVRPSRPKFVRKNPRADEDGEVFRTELYDPDVDHDSENQAERRAAKVSAKKAKKIKDEEINDDSKLDTETDDEGEEEPETESKFAKYGKDVTDDTTGAEEKDLKVFKKGANYFVFDADGDEPLTDKPLTKQKVKQFIAKYQG